MPSSLVRTDDIVNRLETCCGPVRLQEIVRDMVRQRLAVTAYGPGSTYEQGQRLQLPDGEMATVEKVERGENSQQGQFQVLYLRLADDNLHCMAAGIHGAKPGQEHEPSVNRVDLALDTELPEIEHDLAKDERICQVDGHVCLAELLPAIDKAALQRIRDALPQDVTSGESPSQSIVDLVQAVFGIDTNHADYALYAFALRRRLSTCSDIICCGDTYMSADAWAALSETLELTMPRVHSSVELPDRVIIAKQLTAKTRPAAQGRQGQAQSAYSESAPSHATFVLHARHYYEGWLPLTQAVSKILPNDGELIEVQVEAHLAEHASISLPAWVDRDRKRILFTDLRRVLETCAVYPGAKLRLEARGERLFDLRTLEIAKTEPVQVCRMWLDDQGGIVFEQGEERRRYAIDDHVFIADARLEDPAALFKQAAETGASIFALMYDVAKANWEAGDQTRLYTADGLFNAIHWDPTKRMTTKATIALELWQRLAFRSVGGGRYRFQPEYGAQLRRHRTMHQFDDESPPSPKPSSPKPAPEPIPDPITQNEHEPSYERHDEMPTGDSNPPPRDNQAPVITSPVLPNAPRVKATEQLAWNPKSPPRYKRYQEPAQRANLNRL